MSKRAVKRRPETDSKKKKKAQAGNLAVDLPPGGSPPGAGGPTAYDEEAPARPTSEASSDIDDWGLCKACKWWQIEPEATVEDQTAGYCIDEKLLPYALRVTGNSGCNHFMKGTPARAAGSGAAPPTAEPQR